MSKTAQRKKTTTAAAPRPPAAQAPVPVSTKPVFAPVYSMKIDIGRKLLHLNVTLPRVPGDLITCDATESIFTLSTPRFSRDYRLNIPYIHGLTIDASAAEAEFLNGNLHIKAPIKSLNEEAEAAERAKADAIKRESRLRFVTLADGTRGVRERSARAKTQDAPKNNKRARSAAAAAEKAAAAATPATADAAAAAAPAAKRPATKATKAATKTPEEKKASASRRSYLSDETSDALALATAATQAANERVQQRIDAMSGAAQAMVEKSGRKAARREQAVDRRTALAAARLAGAKGEADDAERQWGRKKQKKLADTDRAAGAGGRLGSHKGARVVSFAGGEGGAQRQAKRVAKKAGRGGKGE